jgi:hypothetical protein
MAIFKYELPSGARFTLEASDGTTQAQADVIFYQQVAAGTFAGYTAGQTLSSTETTLAKFGLTRLDRGTAGVDNLTVLSIVSGLPIVIELPAITDSPTIAQNSPIDQGDVIATSIPLGADGIATLSGIQVQSIEAQLVNLVGQESNVISQLSGIGKYGFNATQLEQTGYLKPGTVAKFLNADTSVYLPNATNFIDVMNSPGVWSGKNGITGLDQILSDEILQTQIQTQLMQNGYVSLTSAGIINPPVEAAAEPLVGKIYQSTSLGGVLQALTGLSLLKPGPFVLPGNTISLTSIVDSATTAITKTINKDIGSLILNSSQFGTPLTSLWASSGGLSSAIGATKSALNNLTVANVPSLSTLTKSLPSLSNLTQGLPSLDSLTKNLPSLSTLSSRLPNAGTLASNLGSLGASMSSIGNMGGFASLFGGGSADALVSNVLPAAAYSGTVNRRTVDVAVAKIIDSSKIPTPGFGIPSVGSLGSVLDISYAQNILKNITNQTSGIVAQVNTSVTQARQLAGSAQTAFNRLTG